MDTNSDVNHSICDIIELTLNFTNYEWILRMIQLSKPITNNLLQWIQSKQLIRMNK